MLEIEKEIEKLREVAPKTAAGLMNQVNKLSATFYNQEDAYCLVEVFEDVLKDSGEIKRDTKLWKEVRTIQEGIIEIFSGD